LSDTELTKVTKGLNNNCRKHLIKNKVILRDSDPIIATSPKTARLQKKEINPIIIINNDRSRIIMGISRGLTIGTITD